MINSELLRLTCHEIFGNANESEYLSAEAYYKDLMEHIQRSQPREFTSIEELVSSYEMSASEV